MINYLTAKTCEVSTWFQRPGARLRHYDEVPMVCALTLLTQSLKSLSEINTFHCASTVCSYSSQRERRYYGGKSGLFFGSSLPHYGFSKVQYRHFWVLFMPVHFQIHAVKPVQVLTCTFIVP